MTGAVVFAALQDASTEWSLDQLLAQGPAPLIRAGLLLFVGIPVVWALARWSRSHVTRRYGAQKGLVVGKLVFYPMLLVILVSVLKELGFSLAPLLQHHQRFLPSRRRTVRDR
jgi:hypothetical protein